MVIHDAVSIDFEKAFLLVEFQNVYEMQIVIAVFKDDLLVVTSKNDVIDVRFADFSGLSGHFYSFDRMI